MNYSSETFERIPAVGAYRPVYRENIVNHCPGCGQKQWHVGRFSAECAFCGTALPLQEGSTRRAYNKPVFFTREGHGPGGKAVDRSN